MAARPFWIAWNTLMSAILLISGIALGSLIHSQPQAEVYCAYKTCVRYWPPEDKEIAMLQQIVALRHNH